jgi:hypothetical protein
MKRAGQPIPDASHDAARSTDEMCSRLPAIPDFDRIEISASETADQRARVLGLIGDLNFAWANNESLLIYFIMLLLGTNEASAAVVFATLNTTRARLDLVERLARTNLRDQPLRRRLKDSLEEFAVLTRVRNEFNHCTFVVGSRGELTHTQTLKLHEARGRLSFGARRALDEDRLTMLQQSSTDLKALNRRMWELLPLVEAAVRRSRN